MTTPLFPHAATIELLSEHLAARSAQAADCYRRAREAAANSLTQHAATLVEEARMHTIKADSYRASMMALTQPKAPAPRPAHVDYPEDHQSGNAAPAARVVPLVKPEDRAWHIGTTLPPPGPEVPLPSAHVTVHGNRYNVAYPQLG